MNLRNENTIVKSQIELKSGQVLRSYEQQGNKSHKLSFEADAVRAKMSHIYVTEVVVNGIIFLPN